MLFLLAARRGFAVGPDDDLALRSAGLKHSRESNDYQLRVESYRNLGFPSRKSPRSLNIAIRMRRPSAARRALRFNPLGEGRPDTRLPCRMCSTRTRTCRTICPLCAATSRTGGSGCTGRMDRGFAQRVGSRCRGRLVGEADEFFTLRPDSKSCGIKLAEREGFEPPIPFRVCRFSRPEPSTTRPPLRLQNQQLNKVTSVIFLTLVHCPRRVVGPLVRKERRCSIVEKSGAFYVVYRITVEGERKQIWHKLCEKNRKTVPAFPRSRLEISEKVPAATDGVVLTTATSM